MTLEATFGLAGRRAMVTGAGRGIGRAAALALAGAGADVALVSRTPCELEETAEAVRAAGVRALCLCADLARPVDAAGAVEAMVAAWGGIDILVNNAGTVAPAAAAALDAESLAAQMAVNAISPVMACRAALPAMIAGGWGRIVNIASLAAWLGTPDHAGYAMSKASLVIYTRTLASELARAGHPIRANCITPGWFDTGMSREAGVVETTATDSAAPDRSRLVLDRIPLGRPALPPEIGGAVLFLASEAASYVTGQEIFVDGGWHNSGI